MRPKPRVDAGRSAISLMENKVTTSGPANQRGAYAAADLSNATWYHGSRYSYPLRGEDTGGAFAFVDILQRRGTEPPPHIHHREHEVFIVLDGAVEFQAGDATYRGEAGAFAFLPRGVPHRFALREPWQRMLIIVTPSGFERYLGPFSRKATHLEEPPPPGELDIPGMIARGVEFGIEFVPPGVDMAVIDHRQPEGLHALIRQREEGERLNVIGIPTTVKLNAAESGGLLSAFVTHDAPRVGPPLHVHRNEDEALIVLEGRYVAQENGARHELAPGMVAYFPRGVAHTYANAGDTPGKLLVITTPGGFETFFREVDRLCQGGPPAEAEFLKVAHRHGLELVGPPVFQTP